MIEKEKIKNYLCGSSPKNSPFFLQISVCTVGCLRIAVMEKTQFYTQNIYHLRLTGLLHRDSSLLKAFFVEISMCFGSNLFSFKQKYCFQLSHFKLYYAIKVVHIKFLHLINIYFFFFPLTIAATVNVLHS